MEKTWNIALVTVADLIRRKVWWAMLLWVFAELAILGIAGRSLEQILAMGPYEHLREPIVQRTVAGVFSLLERFGTLFLPFLFAGVLSSDRDAGLWDFYWSLPLSRSRYLAGKLLGALIVTIGFVMPCIVLMLSYAHMQRGEIGLDLWQACTLMTLRFAMLAIAGMLCSLWWRPAFAGFAGLMLIYLPMVLHAMITRWDVSWARWPLMVLPATDWFVAGWPLTERRMLVPEQFAGVVAFGMMTCALLIALMSLRIERMESARE